MGSFLHKKVGHVCFSVIGFLKRRILLKMHQIFVGAAPGQIFDVLSILSRSTRFCNQFIIIRVKSKLGRSSLQYRDPNIWNFINKKDKLCNVSKEGLKAILRKHSKDILTFHSIRKLL